MLEYSWFEKLPLRSQLESLAKEGTVLAHRNHNQWLVTLYSFNGAFVEVWAGNKVEVIGTFKKSANAIAVLEPYIDDIDVQDFIDSDG